MPPSLPITTYATGWLVLALVAGPALWAAVEARRLVLPSWSDAWAALVVIVASASLILVESEVLGTFGLFRRWPLCVLSVLASGGLATYLRACPRPRDEPDVPGPPLDRPACIGAAVVVLAVLSEWSAWILATLRRGSTGFDAMAYHSPFAARFAQTGSLTHLHNIVPGEAMPFYPANTEVWHAIGMLAFGHDTITPFINALSLLVAFLAAWCIGRRFGGAPGAVAAVAAISAVPYFAYTAAGTSFNDAPAMAALLAAAALMARTSDDRAATFFAALAVGLAAGTKLSFLAAAALVSLAGVSLVPRGRRLAAAAGWAGTAALTCGYWYLRNLVRVGNPVPGLSIGVGPIRLPSPALPVDVRFGSRLATSFDIHRWASVYEPGLRDYLGRPWLLVVVALAAGVVLSLAGRSAWHRAIGLVCLGALAVYSITPITGDPTFFKFNIRYTIPSQCLAAVLIATVAGLGGRWAQRAVVAVAAVTTALAFPDPNAVARRIPGTNQLPGWPPGWQHRIAGIVVVVAAFGVIAAIRALARAADDDRFLDYLGLHRPRHMLRGTRRHRRRRSVVWIVQASGTAVVVTAAMVAGAGAADRFEKIRYQRLPGELGPAWGWAQGVRDARIGVVNLYQQYPLTGPDVSNYVQYVGVSTPHHGFARVGSCAQWRTAVNAGRYRYIVTSRDGYFPPPGEPPEAIWTRSDPAAREILHNDVTSVFEITGPLDPNGCGPALVPPAPVP